MTQRIREFSLFNLFEHSVFAHGRVSIENEVVSIVFVSRIISLTLAGLGLITMEDLGQPFYGR